MKKTLLVSLVLFLGTMSIIFVINACTPKTSIPLKQGQLTKTYSDQSYLLWQTNAEGDDIHIVNLEKKQAVRRLKVGPNPHGIAYSKTRNTVYIALEHNDETQGELLWIDATTFKILKRIKVGPEPHEIEVTPDGAYIYVPCRDGHYWVIDGDSGEVLTKIKTGGRPHNTSVSDDGQFMYLSPMDAPKKVTIVNTQIGHQVVGTIEFNNSVRPPAITKDGQLFFQQVDGLNGFEVASIPQQKQIARVEHEEKLGSFKLHNKLGWLSNRGFNRCHGLEIHPNQQEIWSVCGDLLRIHNITNFIFPETHSFNLGVKAYWLTFSPDGKYAVIALSNTNEVLVVDADKKQELYRFKVGEKPKRNLVIQRVNQQHDEKKDIY